MGDFICAILLVIAIVWLCFNTYGFVKWFKNRKKQKSLENKDENKNEEKGGK